MLETIRAGKPISRAEISRRAGISKPTVSLALQSLLESGLVREAAHDPAGPSYGAVFFEPVPGFRAGISYGRTWDNYEDKQQAINDRVMGSAPFHARSVPYAFRRP